MQALRHLQQEGGAGAALLGLHQPLLQHRHRAGGNAVAAQVGQFAHRLLRGQAFGQPAQVFHQHHAQGGRQRPHLGQAELARFLVRAQELHQQFLVEGAVGVGHEGPGHAIHARQAGQRLVHQHRQRAEVAARQALVDGQQLRLDEMEVVQQPQRCRAQLLADGALRGDGQVRGAQHLDVAAQAREEARCRPARAARAVRQPQAATMLGKALRAEDLGPQRRLRHAAVRLQEKAQRRCQLVQQPRRRRR